jgi:mitogen-activated protein kinase kinase
MANRGPPNGAPSVDAATSALKRATIHDQRAPVPPLPNSPPQGTVSRRPKPGLRLNDIQGTFGAVSGGAAAAGLGAGRPPLGADSLTPRRAPHNFGTPFANFHKIVYVFRHQSLVVTFNLSFSDPSGALNFSDKAVLHASGVDFSSGSSYAINMDQLQLFEDLGKGTYGVVKRVLHKPTNVAMAMKVCLLLVSDIHGH